MKTPRMKDTSKRAHRILIHTFRDSQEALVIKKT